MQVSNEIRSNMENIKYYADEIQKKIEEQLKMDFKRAEELGVNVNAGTIRYDTLAIIHANCDLVKLYLDNIEANLKSAESQDKLLYSDNNSSQEGLL